MAPSEIPSQAKIGEPRTGNLLDSWKEIAAYLGREVRTVQRWEKKEGLPVHRRLHEKAGSVYAYKSEIDAWWNERSSTLAPECEEVPPARRKHLRILSWPGRTQQVPEARPAEDIPARNLKKLAISTLAIVAAVSIGFILRQVLSLGGWGFRSVPLQGMRLIQLTFTGQIKDAAISPDGKYVAFLNQDVGGRSLWIHQVATKSNAQVISAGPWDSRLTFSPDGNYIYYEHLDSSESLGLYGLYRVPMVGGNPRKLISDLDTPVTFSPDGKRLAFLRNSNERAEMALIVTNADGTNERKIAVRKRQGGFIFVAPAWSPDGRLIAVGIGYGEIGDHRRIEVVEVDTGRERLLGPRSWRSLGRMAWLPDGRGLVFVASENTSSTNTQIWQVDFPRGEVHRVTNDLNNYLALTASADGKAFAVVQSRVSSSLWIAPQGNWAYAKQLVPEGDTVDGNSGFTWTADGRILYTSYHAGGESMRTVSPDGTNVKDFLLGPGLNRRPSACRDGRYILFASLRDNGRNVYRTDSDGREIKQLTFGNENGFPQCAPDGKWFIYGSGDKGQSALLKMSIEGGQPTLISDKYCGWPRLSPDGRWIAALFQDPPGNYKIGVIPVEGGDLRWTFDPPEGTEWDSHLAWTPDGGGLVFSVARGGVSNLWVHPLSGAPPSRLTDFKDGRIFSFNWSPDGTDLVLARGSMTSDVVLLTKNK